MRDRKKVMSPAFIACPRIPSPSSPHRPQRPNSRTQNRAESDGLSNVSANLIMGMAKRDNKLGRDSAKGGALKEVGIDLSKLNKVKNNRACVAKETTAGDCPGLLYRHLRNPSRTLNRRLTTRTPLPNRLTERNIRTGRPRPPPG